MAYVVPAIPDFKAQFGRDFPFATPLFVAGVVVATATAVLGAANNGIASITVVSGGSGYKHLPTVIISGGGGVGARAVAALTSGVVTSVTLLDPGYGYTQPTVTVYFSTGEGDNTSDKNVTDFDIASAIAKATNFNVTNGLFGSQAAFTQAYNLLAAHYLCTTLQASEAGLGGQAQWLTQSKTVGDVTEAFQIPERIMKSPYLSKLSKTTYGAQFLELVSPALVGNMGTFYRPTSP